MSLAVLFLLGSSWCHWLILLVGAAELATRAGSSVPLSGWDLAVLCGLFASALAAIWSGLTALVLHVWRGRSSQRVSLGMGAAVLHAVVLGLAFMVVHMNGRGPMANQVNLALLGLLQVLAMAASGFLPSGRGHEEMPG